jgi:hypothetical protein
VQDTDTYCENLLKLVEDDALRTRLGAASRSHVLERFSYQRLMKDMSELYFDLLDKKTK